MCFLHQGYQLEFTNHPGSYVVKKVLGRGSSAIVYLADYMNASGICSERILKECYPYNLKLKRECDGTVICPEEFREKFAAGKNLFAMSGQRQNELREKIYLRNEIPPILNVFENNNTIYLEVTPYNGRIFSENEQMTLLQRVKLCIAVAKLIQQYHSEGYLCLDLKPENIFVLTNSAGEIVTDLVEYIDFDSIVKKGTMLFGKTLSYTEEWAAPEQLNPYSYNRIAETTDIYCLGELVFWSVFNRHSIEVEHRSFTQFPFDDIENQFYNELQSTSVRTAFTNFFHATLRSSPRNRCQTMSEALSFLSIIEEELKKKYKAVISPIVPNKCFLGRENEMLELHNLISMSRVVFVSGTMGVGKSELLKQYCKQNSNYYDNIIFWTYEGSLSKMIARDIPVSITNFQRIEEETDLQYAIRKIKKLSEILSHYKNLIVIDNLDCAVDTITENGLWRQLEGFSADIVVGTRVSETFFDTLHIGPLTREEDLVSLFSQYTDVNESNKDDVMRFIEESGRNTLLIELIARQISAAHCTPGQMLNAYLQGGPKNLPIEQFRIRKDDNVTSATIAKHVERLFNLSDMPESQLLQLAMLSLMPAQGVPILKFKNFFRINSCDDLNTLCQRGFIHEDENNNGSISVHQSVAMVAMNFIKENDDYLKNLLSTCYNAMHIRKVPAFTEREHRMYVSAMIYSISNRYHVESRETAILIQRYIDAFLRFGESVEKLNLIDYAINVFKRYNEKNKYSAMLEYQYFLKAELLRFIERYSESESICKRHVEYAKDKKDTFLTALWYSRLSCLEAKKGVNKTNLRIQLMYYYKALYYVEVFRRHSQHKSRFDKISKLLDYDYLADNRKKCINFALSSFALNLEEIDSEEFFFLNFQTCYWKNLKAAINIRREVNHGTSIKDNPNGYEIYIDYAKIAYLKREFNDAIVNLKAVEKCFEKYGREEDSILYRIYKIYGYIYLNIGESEYKNGIKYFKKCMDIEEQLNIPEDAQMRVDLQYMCIICDEKETSINLGTDILLESQKMETPKRNLIYAQELTNEGLILMGERKYKEAREVFFHAHDVFALSTDKMSIRSFGEARLTRLMAEVSRNIQDDDTYDVATEVEFFKGAICLYQKCVGEQYPEAQKCLVRLDELR